MRMTMEERKTVTKALTKQYGKARKKEKGRILTSLVEATGYNRSYAARVLRGHGRRVEVAPGVVLEGSVRRRRTRARWRSYGPEVAKALREVWKMLDCIASKRLAAALPEVVPRLVALGELKASKAVQRKLVEISPATIDRLLKPDRARYRLKGRGRTKPGTLLKHQVPIRTFSDWDDAQPGFVEMDLVAHDGGGAYGEYCQTLDVTDVATGWSEQVAVPTKAQKWVFQALGDIGRRLPFALRGLDSDNGAEFINNQLFRYCRLHHITFTRARPYRKNDTCYVEQKNWSIVRRYVGYGRYETENARACLNELYALLRDYVNFFLPSMKLKQKVRHGARVCRRYFPPQTPYQRVLQSAHVSPAVKRRLRTHYHKLNPAALQRRIDTLQRKLLRLTTRSTARRTHTQSLPPQPAPNHPWRRTWNSPWP